MTPPPSTPSSRTDSRRTPPAPRWLPAALLAALAAWPAVSPGLAETRYVAFGDSITEGIDHDELCLCQCSEECGYPRRLERLLRNAGVDATLINRGLGGEKTPEGLTRLEAVLQDPGDVLLLMEGTNDISRAISPETTLFNLAEMARKATAAGMETVHVTLIPRYPQARIDADNVLNGSLARNIRELAFDHGRRLADPFEVFLAIPNVFETHYGNVPTDGVGHPTSFGYDSLARVFFNVLRERDRVAPVLGFVEPADGSEDLSPLSRVRLRLYDFGTGIDLDETRLLVDGSEVPYQAVGDPQRFELSYFPDLPLPNPASIRLRTQDLEDPPNTVDRLVTSFTVTAEIPQPCTPDEVTLCIDDKPGDGRFKVTMDWQTELNGGRSGQAFATPLALVGLPAGGLLSFVEGNPEVLVKVLDGCAINQRFWVFVSPTTTLGYELVVEDTLARIRGAESSAYELRLSNPDGELAASFFSVEAFDTCDFKQ